MIIAGHHWHQRTSWDEKRIQTDQNFGLLRVLDHETINLLDRNSYSTSLIEKLHSVSLHYGPKKKRKKGKYDRVYLRNALLSR